MMSRWLLALLVLFALPRVAAASEDTTDCVTKPCFVVVGMLDDVGPINIKAFHELGTELYADGKLPGDPTRAFKSIETPSLSRLAAAGLMIPGLYVNSVCSPTREEILAGIIQSHYANLLGSVVRPDNDPSWYDPNLAIETLPRILEANGVGTHWAGKMHVNHDSINDPAIGVTAAKQLGFTSADSIRIGNDNNPWIIDYTQGVLPGSVNVWDDCKGHNYGPTMDLDGNIVFSNVNTGKQDYDSTMAYIAAQTTGMHVIFVWDNLGHTPSKPGTGGAGPCNYADGGAGQSQHDWPPGYSNPTDGTTEDETWLAGLDYVNNRIGLLLDAIEIIDGVPIGETSDSVVCVLADNGDGAARSNSLHPTECDSNFSKGSEFECGVRAGLICAGRGIEQGSMSQSMRFNAADLMPTILAMNGIDDPNGSRTSQSMWDCMRQVNGQSHTSCSAERLFAPYNRWEEVGGQDRTRATLPNPLTDPINEWITLTHGGRFTWEGVDYYLGRNYTDFSVSPYLCVLSLVKYEYLSPAVAVRYRGTELAVTSVDASDCTITSFDSLDWDMTPTDDQIAALAYGMKWIRSWGALPVSSY